MGLGKTIEMLSLVHSHGLSADTLAKPKDEPRTRTLLGHPVKPAPRTTLVVAPMSLLRQWQTEAERASAPGSLRAIVYYGTEKNINLQTLCGSSTIDDIPTLIITSYGIVLSEYNAIASSKEGLRTHRGLFSVEFLRVILDEAHSIKNRQAKTAKACYEIAAKHRWVLTGTPIVNRLEDLFSLVRFLRVEPWSNFSYWKTFITVPFESKNFLKALDVVQTVLEPLVLRRTKDMKTPTGDPLVPLPPKTVLIERLQLSDVEREVYERIFKRARSTFAHSVENGTVMKSYSTLLAQILRLRQSCCHPNLVRHALVVDDEAEALEKATIESLADAGRIGVDDVDLSDLIARFSSLEEDTDANVFGADVLKEIAKGSKSECPICLSEPIEEQTITGCWHSACKNCLTEFVKRETDNGKVPRCFNCRKDINSRDLYEVVSRVAPVDEEALSTPSASQGSLMKVSLRRLGTHGSAKIAALLTHLNTVRQDDKTVKSVVFSQFTSFLDLLEQALNRDSIPFVRFDGSMSQKQRIKVLSEFQESKKGLVLLLSLKAGGVGLNLTHAKRVYMMDPWWSFAVEAQAIDRVHRMGQDAPVTIVRFIIDNSVEDRMLKVQDRKKFM
jgi:DNA repair protein RAD5